MKKGKRAKENRVNACLVAVWLLLTMLTGFLMLMVATTKAHAAENDMPEVLRYAREYPGLLRGKRLRCRRRKVWHGNWLVQSLSGASSGLVLMPWRRG
ncbi:hypothetical protein AAB59_17000 [Salmonella enterica subsp. enterica serovar Typhimurium]|nr:hypothetical protein [Salmonella enterica subsp. enterica serovar Kottbus]ECV8848555.1 hypothetical protein [Salmonella enterica subsp. enterica serovar Typhimurium]